jgi:hypothetical protein
MLINVDAVRYDAVRMMMVLFVSVLKNGCPALDEREQLYRNEKENIICWGKANKNLIVDMRRRRRNVNNDCGEEKEDLKKGRRRKEGGEGEGEGERRWEGERVLV